MKLKTSRRELITPRGDKGYIRRDAKGRITESDDVGCSLPGIEAARPRRSRKPVKEIAATERWCQSPGSGPASVPSANTPSDLFGTERLPQGFQYEGDLLDANEEAVLLEKIKSLPFRDFEFHGFVGKRRVVSFGWRYDFNGGGLNKTEDMPDFLMPVRAKAAAFANIPPETLQQVLITEYGPGAAIGWHRDRSVFGDVVGLSLLSSCTFRLRRKQGGRWERKNLTIEPRSVYVLRGPSRTKWEHSIAAVSTLRYSITFRNVLDKE